MPIKAEAFEAINLTDDGATVRLAFSMGHSKIEEVVMPAEMFELGVPDMQRIGIAIKQHRDIHMVNINKTAYSPVGTVEARVDPLFSHVYIILDDQQINRITFRLNFRESIKLAFQIMRLVEKNTYSHPTKN